MLSAILNRKTDRRGGTPFLGLILFCTLIFSSVQPPLVSLTSAQNIPLVVAARENHEPFSYTDIHGQPAGLFVDLWRLWASRTGRSVKFVLSETMDMENRILDGRADAWTGLFTLASHPELALSDPVMLLFRAPTVTTHDGVLAIRVAVRPDRTDLLTEINQGFLKLTEKDRQTLLVRWWPQDNWVHLPRSRLINAMLLGGAFLILWAIGAYALYRFKLQGKSQELLAALTELRLKNKVLQSEIAERRQVEKDKERLIQELREALENVRKLRGLLPICAYCKKIRDDLGYWNQLESYLSQHADVTFTHSICPECSKKIYEELKAFKDAEQQKKKAVSG
ncbi:MAG: transporter substrate-binding domain-containing protein [Desulfosoma sp.]